MKNDFRNINDYEKCNQRQSIKKKAMHMHIMYCIAKKPAKHNLHLWEKSNQIKFLIKEILIMNNYKYSDVKYKQLCLDYLFV